jgi:hypothetical protein
MYEYIELNSEVNAHDGKGIEVSFIKVEGLSELIS